MTWRGVRRFFVEGVQLHGERVELTGPLARRLSRVLRMRAGEEVALFDGNGTDVRVRLAEVRDVFVAGEVVGWEAGPGEAMTRVHLYQAVTKGERFEWLIEKATEIGVASVTPLVTARSVVKPGGEGNRAERWRRIAVEAAEQCERSTVPAVSGPLSLVEALARAEGVLVLPYEEAGDSARSIGALIAHEIDAVFAERAVSIFVGPEGGFEPGEVARAEEAGARVVSLGERVLRSETAGLVAATLALAACGDLG